MRPICIAYDLLSQADMAAFLVAMDPSSYRDQLPRSSTTHLEGAQQCGRYIGSIRYDAEQCMYGEVKRVEDEVSTTMQAHAGR